MKVIFSIHFHTHWGQEMHLTGSPTQLGDWDPDKSIGMHYQGDGRWRLEMDLPDDTASFSYQYLLREQGGIHREWGEPRECNLPDIGFESLAFEDEWRGHQRDENAFFSAAFTKVLMRRPEQKKTRKKQFKGDVYRFQLYAPRVAPHLRICISGDHTALGKWDEKKAIVMQDQQFPLWTADVVFRGKAKEVAFKYGIYDTVQRKIIHWEAGENRRQSLRPIQSGQKALNIRTDTQFRYPIDNWKGAGIALPVFSLRSDQGMGVGEFTDLKKLVDFSEEVGLKLIQILPINDTVATHSWIDSYPYAAISVFALHPMYANLEKMGTLKDKKAMKVFAAQRKALNALTEVDYEAVMRVKSEYFKRLFEQDQSKILADQEMLAFVEEHAEWLKPYAAFSYLRDQHGTADFNQWEEHSVFDQEKVDALVSPDHTNYPDIAIHYFIQYHLHIQLKEAAEYARDRGIILKGDIPIGIYRHSVDAWVAPYLYNMDSQAGAPPDGFAVKGQNWRFPTYNWHEMAQDNYAWWRKRLQHLATYFDTYRIDHILGFFRIWEIPGHAVDGLLGQFSPQMAFSREELLQRGVWMDDERLTKPYIRHHFLESFFGEYTQEVIEEFLELYPDGRYQFKPGLETQRAIERYLAEREQADPSLTTRNSRIREALYGLVTEVIFMEAPFSSGNAFAPRVGLQFTHSFRELPSHLQEAINALYTDYFYHRQEDFWAHHAMIKLPAIQGATDMLICGEDLGMVPDCVPGVMKSLDMLSLEIQRMPKDPKKRFGHPSDYPYLSVCSTSTHDMGTLRGWWESDRAEIQAFYHDLLGHPGEAPYYCEPWIAREVINQHLYSPSMWAIFPIQDLLAMDGRLRRDNPHDEQINVPANPQHYWRYRLHFGLEALNQQAAFKDLLSMMIRQSGRNEAY
ncbi:MAG: 4-alpha-glucanotransferase [Bacteroidota bacterium]